MSASLRPVSSGNAARRLRVAVVDDSVIVRGLFSRWLTEMPDVELVGVHRNSMEALRQVSTSKPDIIVLDIEMPEIDGLTALPMLLEASPLSRVLVVSGVSIRGADMTLRCLMRGASDYLPKPSSIAEVSTSSDFREELQTRVRTLGWRQLAPKQPAKPETEVAPITPPSGTRWPEVAQALARLQSAAGFLTEDEADLRPASLLKPELVVVGASTGGPAAVTQFLQGTRLAFSDVPVVVAQHMPATFTMLFADHLRRHAGLEACEIGGGEILKPGFVHVVRGGRDVELVRNGAGFAAVAVKDSVLRRQQSVDVLMLSAAICAGAATLAVVLTGSGSDGTRGAAAVAAAGGTILAQDEASSVVWGMPGGIVRGGYAAKVSDLHGLIQTAHELAGYR